MSDVLTDGLLQRHRDELVGGSGIDPAVVVERGYRSILGKAEPLWEEHGFGSVQRRGPALFLPTWTVEGRQEGGSVKPDSPRKDSKGKAIKYEHPRGGRPTIDVHPRVRPVLADPSVPLGITEGKKKADAGISHGLQMVALDGVWNFRGTNEYDGKVALAQWEQIALNGRRVTIYFDSDAKDNLQVQRALDRLIPFLQRREADVWVCRLPSKPDGAKCGLDDFLLEHTVEQLASYCQPADEPEREPQFYVSPDGWLVRRSTDRQGQPVEQRIANFVMVIREDISIDDGDAPERTYMLRLKHASGKIRDVRIGARDFNDPRMAQKLILSEAGPEFIPEQGQFPAVLLGAQKLSEGRTEQRIYYTHTGWVETDRGRRFLTPTMALGPDGPDENVYLDIHGEGVDHYGVSWPSRPEDGVAAWEALAAAIRAASSRVALPLVAHLALAPITSSIPIAKPALLHVVSDTGAFKTTYATLLLNLYGDFGQETPPATWTSTVNALERISFTLKDLPLLIDDFKLQHIRRSEDLVRFVQNYGDRTSRGRMKANLELRRSFPARGLLFSTGEDVPEREASVLGRMLIVDVRPGDIDVDLLSEAQRLMGGLRYLGARWLAWLCRNWQEVERRCLTDFTGTRDELAKAMPGTHARIPVAAAQLQIAFDLFTDFLVEEYPEYRELIETWATQLRVALVAIGGAQGDRVKQERPSAAFIEWLSGEVATERLKLESLEGGYYYIGGKDAPLVGWFRRDDGVYLQSAVAWSAWTQAQRREGQQVQWTRNAVWKQLATDGLLARTESGRTTVLVKVKGFPVRCLALAEDAFGDIAESQREASK